MTFNYPRHLQKILAALLILMAVSPLRAGVDFAGKGKALALEIATNPGGFLYDLHQMTESVAPTRTGRRWSIGTQVLPTFLPFTFGNIYARFNLLSEHPNIPQVELFAGYSRLVALEFAASDSTEGSVSGKHYGLSVMQSIHPKARLQLAYETSILTGEAKFKKKPLKLYGTTLNSVKVDIGESFMLVGSEISRSQRRYLVTQMGFGLKSSKILARVVFVGHVWDWGLTVYPEGPLVIYPTLGLRFGG